MKKIKVAFLLTFFAVQAAYAQIGAGNMFFGGAVEINNNDAGNSFRFEPKGYYFLTDNIALGSSILFETFRDNPDQDTYERQTLFGLEPGIRYFHSLTENLYLYGEATLGFSFGGTTAHVGNTSTEISDINVLRFAISPGLMYLIGDKIGMDLRINLLSVARNSVTFDVAGNDVTATSTPFRLGVNTLAPSIGLYYFLK